MLYIKEAILVEGRYDKNALSQVVNTLILETGGFRIFQDPEQRALLRQVARTRGLIVFTDSDGAGFLIRGHIKGVVPQQYLKHAYIPDVLGKERRKRRAGKEGKIGVEGMPPQVLEQALRRAGATFLEGERATTYAGRPLTKADLMAAGLTGGAESAARRQALLARLRLPQRMNANGLLAVLNGCYSREQALGLLREDIQQQG